MIELVAGVKKAEVTTFSLDDLTYHQALTIGLFQCLAVYPGFSRAGSTISGGLLAKVNYKTASEFSFLIALPVMVGATGLDLLKSWKYLSVNNIPMFAVGFLTSFIVAMLAVVTFLKLLENIGLKPFCILSYFVGYLIYAFRIAIDSYESHIIKPIFKLEYRFFIYFTSSITHFNMA